MKVEIDGSGLLTISPETALEEYAIRAWCREHWPQTQAGKQLNLTKILIRGSIEGQDKYKGETDGS